MGLLGLLGLRRWIGGLLTARWIGRVGRVGGRPDVGVAALLALWVAALLALWVAALLALRWLTAHVFEIPQLIQSSVGLVLGNPGSLVPIGSCSINHLAESINRSINVENNRFL